MNSYHYVNRGDFESEQGLWRPGRDQVGTRWRTVWLKLAEALQVLLTSRQLLQLCSGDGL